MAIYICPSMVYAQHSKGFSCFRYSSLINRYMMVIIYGTKTTNPSANPMLIAATARKKYTPATVEIKRLTFFSFTNPVYSQSVMPVMMAKRRMKVSGRHMMPPTMMATNKTPKMVRVIRFFIVILVVWDISRLVVWDITLVLLDLLFILFLCQPYSLRHILKLRLTFR